MSKIENKLSPSGLWEACSSMEAAAIAKLTSDLHPFCAAIADCYEAGVQVPTLPAKRNGSDDLLLSALFLKRVLNDLRSVWTQTATGYTSQAASVAAALFEHALVVEALAGSAENAVRVRRSKNGDLPWSVVDLAKIHAHNLRQDAQKKGTAFTADDYELAWREVYGAYKFLCKIKHPTIRSTSHDAPATCVHNTEYVIMASPDLRVEDMPVKATILIMSISRTHQAIRWFARSMDCITSHDCYQDFMDRMARVIPAASKAYSDQMMSPLPFDLASENFASEYRALKQQKAKISTKRNSARD